MKNVRQTARTVTCAALLLASSNVHSVRAPQKGTTLATCRSDTSGKSDQVPGGLARSDWSSIRAVYEANRHAAFPIDGGHQARNPGQRWLTKWDGRGFTTQPDGGGWQWGLELRSYGFAGSERAISGKPEAQASGQRMTYAWDAALQEWFINDQRGLEHGFTLKERPKEISNLNSQIANALTFTLAVRGGLRPQATADGQSVCFLNAQSNAVVSYSGLKVWDADGKSLPAQFASSDAGLRLTVDERGAAYPLTIDPIAQQAYLKASNTGAGDRFGSSVAISGDIVVVGAHNEDSSRTGVNGSGLDNDAQDSGAAYVFVRTGTTWTQQAYLKPSNTGANDGFGSSVAISGNTIVVGAPGEDSNATGVNGNHNDNSVLDAGAAYVFVWNGTFWFQQAYLKASNTDTNSNSDSFGGSVAVSGDTVVVGAPNETGTGTGVNPPPTRGDIFNDSGAAYVFVRSGTTWSQQAYLKASINRQAFFGSSVAVSGNTLVVGARGESSGATGVDGNQADNSASFSGAAYAFVRNGTTWSQQAYLKASNTGAGDEFGASVALSGDTIVVGARQEDSNATGVNGNQADNSLEQAGAAYVFVRSTPPGFPVPVWRQQAYLKASDTGAGNQFGSSVAVSGDIVAVSGLGAYLFSRTGTTWTQQAHLTGNGSDSFGFPVAVSGDTLVAGASTDNSSAIGVNGNPADAGAIGSGAAYVFTGLPLAVIAVSGNGNAINDGDSQANITNDTMLGSTSVLFGPAIVRTFTVTNSGTANLTLGNVTISGPQGADFVVSKQPADVVAPETSTTFQIRFAPTARGFRNATVSFATTDFARNPFDFAIAGFGLSSNADLSNIALSSGTLSPTFNPAFTNYTASVRFNRSSITVTPTKLEPGGSVRIRVNGGAYDNVTSGTASGPLPLNVGTNSIEIVVTSEDGNGMKSYTLIITRLEIAAGDVEPEFNFIVEGRHPVFSIVPQLDGKIVIGAPFNFGGGAFPRNYLARLLPDGAVDTGFTSDADNPVFGGALQTDGKIILFGQFTQLGGEVRNYIGRVNTNSSLDSAFNPGANNPAYSVSFQTDGKTVVGGSFTNLAGGGRNFIGRLVPAGTLDPAFDSPFNTEVPFPLYCTAVQPNGKILIAGQFGPLAGIERHDIARLNSDGTLDTGFVDPNPDQYVSSIAVQVDGKIVIGGLFTAVNGAARSRIARLMPDGTLDPSFDPSAFSPSGAIVITSIALQADGKIIIGGIFTTVAGLPRMGIARLNPNGTPDQLFNPNPDDSVHAVTLRADGKILVGGEFQNMDGLPAHGLALLHNDLATQSLTVNNSNRVQWLRGGASPETHLVTFELSTNGGALFTPLGLGTRISGGWELTGLSLPASGHIRARARITGAYFCSSSSLAETVTGFPSNAPPLLSVSLTTTNTLAVVWPSSLSGVVLQQNIVGIATPNWSNITDSIHDDGTNRTFLIVPQAGNGFLRLVTP